MTVPKHNIMNIKIFTLMCIIHYCYGVIVNHGAKYGVNDLRFQDNDGKWKSVKVVQASHPSIWQNYENYGHPNYEFEYAVSDKASGDHKYQRESRRGGHVTGEYGLREADGSLRQVQYHADDEHGFNAIVTKSFQKHGEDAYSMFGHTRHFQKFGQGVKINNFFPRKNYNSQKYESMRPTMPMMVPTPDQSAKLMSVKIGAKPIQNTVELMKKEVVDDGRNKETIKSETTNVTKSNKAKMIEVMKEATDNKKTSDGIMTEDMKEIGMLQKNSQVKQLMAQETTTKVPAKVFTELPRFMTVMVPGYSKTETTKINPEEMIVPLPVTEKYEKAEETPVQEYKIQEYTDSMGSSSIFKKMYYILY